MGGNKIMKQQESLKDTIYQSILNGIFTDEYKAGQIINEQELVKKYGCSKTPIREALVALCNDGILQSFPRFGYQVVSLTMEDISHILNFRYILESSCLTQCFDTITDAQLLLLEKADVDCKKENTSLWDHWDANTNFHITLISFAENPYITSELTRSMTILKRAYAQFYWQRWQHRSASMDIKHHSTLIQAIREKNLSAALYDLKKDLDDFCI